MKSRHWIKSSIRDGSASPTTMKSNGKVNQPSVKKADIQRSPCIGKVRRSQVNTTIYLLIVCINMQVAKQQCQHPRWPTIYGTTIRNIRQLSAMQKLYTPKARTANLLPKESERGQDAGRTLNPKAICTCLCSSLTMP